MVDHSLVWKSVNDMKEKGVNESVMVDKENGRKSQVTWYKGRKMMMMMMTMMLIILESLIC